MGDDDNKLFVGRLPDDIREDEIRMIFGTYGKVEYLKILDKGAQKAAFVTYETKQGADVAVQVLNDVYRFRTDAKDPIHVSHARTGGGGGMSSSRSSRSDQGPPPSYGSAGGSGGGCYGGYAPGYAYGGGGYPPPSYGQDANAHSRDRQHRDDGGGGGGGSNAGQKIYVANLPEDIHKDALEYVFRTYGRLEDVHIMSGRSKSGRAAAFIVYSHPDEAGKAIKAMQSGYEIRPGQGDIQVKFASDQRPPRDNPRSQPY